MLVRFSVKNLFSFDQQASLSMVAGKTQAHPDHLVKGLRKSDPKLLKSAVIYGANAAGKTNLAKAMGLARQIIIRGIEPNSLLPFFPFRLRTGAKNEAAEIEFEIALSEAIFSYSFSFRSDAILSERLVRIGPASEKEVFSRIGSGANPEIKLSPAFHGETAKDRQYYEFVAKGTRPNQLFLTEAVSRNAKGLYREVYDWFARKLTIIFPDTELGQRESLIRSDERLRKGYLEYFKTFDIGLEGLNVEEFELENAVYAFPETFKIDIKKKLKPGVSIEGINPTTGQRVLFTTKENGDVIALSLQFLHKNNEGKNIHFELNEESDGTKRLVDLIPALVQFHDEESVFFIDELDRSLHPSLSRAFLETFYQSSHARSQLLVTTHDIDLLDLNALRKDEIWFVEKDKLGASRVYSLEEFKPRFDNDIRKGYMLGRFGAIPVIRKPQGLGW